MKKVMLLLATVVALALPIGSTFAQDNAASRFPIPPPPSGPGVPDVDVTPLGGDATCKAGNRDIPLLHLAQVKFSIAPGNLIPRNNRDGFRLNLLPRDIPLLLILRENPRRLQDVKGRVLAFLRARDNDRTNRSRIEVLGVDYAAVCATPVEDDDTPGPPHPPIPPH